MSGLNGQFNARLQKLEKESGSGDIVELSTATSNAIIVAIQGAAPTAITNGTAKFNATLTNVLSESEKAAIKTACANAIEKGKGSHIRFQSSVLTPTFYENVSWSNIGFLISNYSIDSSGVTYTFRITVVMKVNKSNTNANATGFIEKFYQQ